MEKSKKTNKGIIIFSIVIFAICVFAIGIMIYFAAKPKLTIVFYKTECVMEEVSTNYEEEYVCAYFRLNSDGNHTLKVSDFSIFSNAKYEEAVKVEYFNQEIRTDFYTYPNQPTLIVYFRVPHSAVDKVAMVKYKDTAMIIGQFVEVR